MMKHFEEEEDTLVCSPKKFRDNHISGGENESALAIKQGSYKDKLVGAIPRAFNQAFGIGDMVHEDLELDAEEDNLQESSTRVLFSKEEKTCMRASWQHALIIKPFGRKVGFSFLDTKIRNTWAFLGKMDNIDLGLDYFLVNFEQLVDMDNILKGGPWFIGQQFLAIRQ